MLYEDMDMAEVMKQVDQNTVSVKDNEKQAALLKDANLHICLDEKHLQARAMFRMPAYCGFYRK